MSLSIYIILVISSLSIQTKMFSESSTTQVIQSLQMISRLIRVQMSISFNCMRASLIKELKSRR